MKRIMRSRLGTVQMEPGTRSDASALLSFGSSRYLPSSIELFRVTFLFVASKVTDSGGLRYMQKPHFKSHESCLCSYWPTPCCTSAADRRSMPYEPKSKLSSMSCISHAAADSLVGQMPRKLAVMEHVHVCDR